jgi:translocation and assembly module TamB
MNGKRVVRWTAIVLGGLLAALVTAAIVVVHTTAFQHFVVSQLEQKTQAGTGARLGIKGLAINWRLLTLDLYGITLHGREKDLQSPLLAADHLRVGLKIISLLRRKVDLREIVLDHPAAHFAVDRSGNSNLPQTNSPGTTSSAVDSILQLAIGHLQLNSGVLYYNDAQIPLNADVQDLRADVHYDPIGGAYAGTVGYNDGRIETEGLKQVPHRLLLNFLLDRSGITANPITIVTAQSTLNVRAKLTNYGHPQLDGTYDAALSTQELARYLNNPSVPAGSVRLTGRLHYENTADKSALESAYVDGQLNSQQLLVEMGQMRAIPKSIRAEFKLQDGNLDVNKVEADLLGGHVSGDYQLSHLSGNSSSHAHALLRDVSLQQLDRTTKIQKGKPLKIGGRVNGAAEAMWTSSIQNGVVKAHFDIRSPNSSSAGEGVIPLSGLIHVAYDGAQNSASFEQSYLQTGSTKITVSGVLSRHSQLSVQANTTDLHEVAALVSFVQAGNSANATDTGSSLPDVGGAAQFMGEVSGAIQQPRIRGDISASDMQVKNAKWRTFHATLDASASGVTFQNASLVDLQNGQINFSGHADLSAWSFTPASPLTLQLSARQISISELQEFFQSQYPVSGIVAANFSIHGSEQNPGGQGSLQITKATAWNEPVKNLNVNFRGDGNAVHTDAQLAMAAGNLAATFTYQPKTQTYEANLTTAGLKLDQLESVQARSLGVAGDVALSAQGSGTFQNPQFTANLKIPKLAIRDQTVSDVQAQFSLANRRATFTVNSRADEGTIQAKGNVGLSGDYPATASIDIRAIPVALVLARYLTKTQDIQGQTEIHLNLDGPLKNPYAIVAQLEIPTLNVNYETAKIGLVRPLKASYRNGVVTVDQAELKGTGTDLNLKGVIPIKSAAPLNVSAVGSLDLSVLQAFTTGTKSSGNINLNISASGDFLHPAMRGNVKIVNAAISTETLPVSIERLNGEIEVSGNRLEVSQLSGAAGGGTVAVRGFVTYGSQSNFNLSLDAKNVRIRYPEGIRSVLSGNLGVAGSPASSQVSGRVLIDRLSFTQQFDMATLLGGFSSDSPSATSSPLESNMKLNVALATAQDINLTSSKVSMGGAANLTLSGTVANPVVLGRATLTSGEMFFMGKRYEIQNGTIEFANPIRTVPVVNLYVKTTVQQYNITLNFVGPVDKLRTNYTSDPPLPPADIINLVAFGKTSEEAASSSSTPASLGAESVLAQGAASQLSGKLEKLAGISQLTIDPLAGNSQSNPGAQVAIQQRVTGKILLTFSTDVTSTQNQAIQVQYQVKKGLSVSVLRDQYGGYAADVRIHKTF